ncbi:tyrosine--tRNA ligase [Methylobacterium sp. sgz302541]|uniref:tyrosine--tRNA ligase n=1 Tax=unclassified Methylobacterium TaxID=2615210 RepID=UPI003D332993
MNSPSFRSDFLRVMSERGFLNQCTDLEGLDAKLSSGEVSAYVGYDMTAKSLHIGNLISLMMLRWLQKTGHRPILLTGTATTKVGDPTGKSEQRPLLTDAQIATNKSHIRTVFERLVSYTGPRAAIEVDNIDWLSKLGYIEFLRDYGVNFTINRMLSFESVKMRLDREEPMTFLEFNYMLMQAVDYLELYRSHGCVLQMGGADQWGNILNGVELTRRMAGAQVFGMTSLLLLNSAGAKMGKTLAGAVWLNAEQFSPYDYWQFWRNCDDADVGKLLKLFTELPMDEIARLERLEGAEINEAKKILADEATALVHDRDAANAARAAAQSAFETAGKLSSDLPTLEVPRHEIEAGLPLANLVARAGLAKSNSEARRLASGGGVRLNDAVISDAGILVEPGHCDADGIIKLMVGKKRLVLVRIV